MDGENPVGGAAGGIKGGLTKKVGPLPVWGYGAIGVGGFLVVRYLRSRSSASTAAVAADPNASIPAAGALNTAASAGTTTISGQLTDLQGTDSAILAALGTIGGTPAPVVPATPVVSPSGSSDGWSGEVHNIFGELLQRQGGVIDPAGAQFWQTATKGVNPLDTLLQVENTPEAQQLAASNPAGFVNGQYQFTGQTADPAGLAYWESQLGAHPTAATVNQESAAFANATAKAQGSNVVRKPA